MSGTLLLSNLQRGRVEMVERRAEQSRTRYRTYYHALKCDGSEEWKAKRARYAVTEKECKAIVKLSRKHACETCNVSFPNLYDLNIHKPPRNTSTILLASSKRSTKTSLYGNISARSVIKPFQIKGC
jgi:hypothetical protein